MWNYVKLVLEYLGWYSLTGLIIFGPGIALGPYMPYSDFGERMYVGWLLEIALGFLLAGIYNIWKRIK